MAQLLCIPSLGVDFDMYTNIIKQGERTVALAIIFKSHGHSANALRP